MRRSSMEKFMNFKKVLIVNLKQVNKCGNIKVESGITA